MLRIPTANEFEEYSERAYVLALDPSRSSFPSYADGIKTKEDFLAIAKRGFESENEEIYIFEHGGEMRGWIHFYVMKEDKHISLEAFETDGFEKEQFAEFAALLKEKYAGYEVTAGFPSQNERAVSATIENGFEIIEESAVNILFFSNYEPQPESGRVEPLTKNNLAVFAKLHDKVEMYWNTKRLTEAYFDGDKWRIYLTEKNGKAAAIYFVFAGNIAEIFGLDFSDGFDGTTAEELLTAALNETKKNVSAKAMYWFTEDERETELAKRFGAEKFTDYKAFCLHI
jgi:hypothetical protein